MTGNGHSVLLDTNSLIYSLKNRVDLKSALFSLPEISNIIVLSCVIAELERMSGDVPFASGALVLAKKFQILDESGPVDDCILASAKRDAYFILTNDRELIMRAKKEHIRVLTIKRNRRIEFS